MDIDHCSGVGKVHISIRRNHILHGVMPLLVVLLFSFSFFSLNGLGDESRDEYTMNGPGVQGEDLFSYVAGGGEGPSGIQEPHIGIGQYSRSYYTADNDFFIYPLLMFIGGIVSLGFMAYTRRKINWMMILGLIFMLGGLSVGALFLPAFVSSPEEYDEWLQEPHEEDDTILVGGYVEEYSYANLGGGMEFYSYQLEGSDYPVITMDDMGEEGDYIIVEVGTDAEGAPARSRGLSRFMILFPTFVLIGLGVIFAFLGFRKLDPSNIPKISAFPYNPYMPPIHSTDPRQPYMYNSPGHPGMPPPVPQNSAPVNPKTYPLPQPVQQHAPQRQPPVERQPPSYQNDKQFSQSGQPIIRCPRCGNPLEPDSRFCDACGYRGQ